MPIPVKACAAAVRVFPSMTRQRRAVPRRLAFLAVAVIVAAVSAVAAGASGGVRFASGFESAKALGWTSSQCAGDLNLPIGIDRGTFGIVSPRSEGIASGAGEFVARIALQPSRLRTACELTQSRPIGIGTDDYYGLMVLFPQTWTDPSPKSLGQGWGALITQFSYPQLSGPPVGLDAYADRVLLELRTGKVSYPPGLGPACGCGAAAFRGWYAAIPPPMALGVWHELIVHVHWATDSSGVVECWHRVRGGSHGKKRVTSAAFRLSSTHPVSSTSTGRGPTVRQQ